MWLIWAIVACFIIFIGACAAGWFLEKVGPSIASDQTGDNWEIEYDSEQDKYFITAKKYFIKSRLNWGDAKRGWADANDARKFAENFLAKRCEKEELAKQRGKASTKIDKNEISRQVAIALSQKQIAQTIEECEKFLKSNNGLVDEATQKLASENEQALEQMRVKFQTVTQNEAEQKTTRRTRVKV